MKKSIYVIILLCSVLALILLPSVYDFTLLKEVDNILQAYGGYLWCGTGLLGWLIVCFRDIINPEVKIGEDAAAGQLFVIALVMGPLLFPLIFFMLIELHTMED